jgi:hypothetical protein
MILISNSTRNLTQWSTAGTITALQLKDGALYRFAIVTIN